MPTLPELFHTPDGKLELPVSVVFVCVDPELNTTVFVPVSSDKAAANPAELLRVFCLPVSCEPSPTKELAVIVPDIIVLPITCNAVAGVVVPITTLPAPVTRIFSTGAEAAVG